MGGRIGNSTLNLYRGHFDTFRIEGPVLGFSLMNSTMQRIPNTLHNIDMTFYRSVVY